MTFLHNHDQILEFLRKIFLKSFQIYQNYLCALNLSYVLNTISVPHPDLNVFFTLVTAIRNAIKGSRQDYMEVWVVSIWLLVTSANHQMANTLVKFPTIDQYSCIIINYNFVIITWTVRPFLSSILFACSCSLRQGTLSSLPCPSEGTQNLLLFPGCLNLLINTHE